MPSGKCLKAFEVVGQPLDKFVLIANSLVSGHGSYDIYLHNLSMLGILHRHFSLNVGQRIVAFEGKIVVFEIENAGHIGVNYHLR